MTPSEIWRAARRLNPHIQLRDVWFILRQLEARGLIHCFNRSDPTGKIFFWTDAGCEVVWTAFGVTLVPAPRGIDWKNYSRIVRGRMRRLVLLELGSVRVRGDEDKSATRIRRNLREQHSVSLNSVIRALKELRAFKLIEIAGEGEKRGQKTYCLSESGRSIANYLAQLLPEPIVRKPF